jgi:hypothetical protein
MKSMLASSSLFDSDSDNNPPKKPQDSLELVKSLFLTLAERETEHIIFTDPVKKQSEDTSPSDNQSTNSYRYTFSYYYAQTLLVLGAVPVAFDAFLNFMDRFDTLDLPHFFSHPAFAIPVNLFVLLIALTGLYLTSKAPTTSGNGWLNTHINRVIEAPTHAKAIAFLVINVSLLLTCPIPTRLLHTANHIIIGGALALFLLAAWIKKRQAPLHPVDRAQNPSKTKEIADVLTFALHCFLPYASYSEDQKKAFSKHKVGYGLLTGCAALCSSLGIITLIHQSGFAPWFRALSSSGHAQLGVAITDCALSAIALLASLLKKQSTEAQTFYPEAPSVTKPMMQVLSVPLFFLSTTYCLAQTGCLDALHTFVQGRVNFLLLGAAIGLFIHMATVKSVQEEKPAKAPPPHLGSVTKEDEAAAIFTSAQNGQHFESPSVTSSHGDLAGPNNDLSPSSAESTAAFPPRSPKSLRAEGRQRHSTVLAHR